MARHCRTNGRPRSFRPRRAAFDHATLHDAALHHTALHEPSGTAIAAKLVICTQRAASKSTRPSNRAVQSGRRDASRSFLGLLRDGGSRWTKGACCHALLGVFQGSRFLEFGDGGPAWHHGLSGAGDVRSRCGSCWGVADADRGFREKPVTFGVPIRPAARLDKSQAVTRQVFAPRSSFSHGRSCRGMTFCKLLCSLDLRTFFSR